MHTSRRNLIKSGGTGMLLASLPFAGAIKATAASLPDRADMVILNAAVHTMDPRQPSAQAVAISGDRVIATGTNEEMLSLASPGTRRLDAQGRTALPGFIDTHNHAVGENLLYDVVVGNPFDVEFVTIESIIEKLRARASQTPPGFWVDGFFFDDTKIKGGRKLTITDLDLVSTEHPVAVHHRGSHSLVVNSLALKLAGVDLSTPNPVGGTFDRGPDGKLDGRVTDAAMQVFATVGKRTVYSAEEAGNRARAGIAHISKQFARYGLTSVHHSAGDFFAMQSVMANGDLLHRINFEPAGSFLDAMIAQGIKTGFGNEWLRIGATFEQYSDGSFSERTMSRKTPYPGTNPPYYGNLGKSQADLDAQVERYVRAGIQPNFHANGDVAIDMVLTAFERATKLIPGREIRPKITHCTNVNPDLVQRIKAVGAVPNLFSTYAYYNSDKFGFYGAEMMEHMMAFRMLLDAGVPVTAGSDFPPGPIAPLMALQGMVTRKGWDNKIWGASQRVTVAEALRVLTANGAIASFEENLKGTISPGKLADIVLLDRDPLTADPETLKDIKVTQTLVGGKTVFSA